MIRISTRHDRTEHDWLVRFIPEVLIEECIEFWPHFFQFFFSGTDLEPCVDKVGGETCFFG